MADLVADVNDELRLRGQSACLVTRLRKGGCSLRLNSAPASRLILDLDREGAPVGPQDTKCDFLFFADKNWVAAIELKAGRLDASVVVRQLQAGAEIVSSLVSRGREIAFRPIVAHSGGHRKEINDLRASKVRYRSQEVPIKAVSCGSLLNNAIKG